MLALIDYGSGNIHSVINALRHEEADVELISDPARLADADAVVLPGVGAFGDCVRGLQSRGLWDPLAAWLAADKPFLGICVGYQMLFEDSEESPGVRVEGPGLLDVTVWRQENSATLHLVNLTNPMAMRGFVREPVLVGEQTITMTLPAGKVASKITLLESGKQLPTPKLRDSTITFVVPSVNLHEVIAVDFS